MSVLHESKRGRGRPKGSGKPDGPTLREVADLLLENPGLKPTTAIKRMGIKNPSDIRRLQAKWREHGPSLCSEAERRCRARRTRASVDNAGRIFTKLDKAVPAVSLTAVSCPEMKTAADQLAASMAGMERATTSAMKALAAEMAEMERATTPDMKAFATSMVEMERATTLSMKALAAEMAEMERATTLGTKALAASMAEMDRFFRTSRINDLVVGRRYG
jgi:hypothetical protein